MKAMTPYSPPRLGISAQPTSLPPWISGALGDQRLTHLYLGPPSAIRLPCRMRRLRHVPNIAARKCDTPGLSQNHAATR